MAASGTVIEPTGRRRRAALTLAAVGVVFGDIGTSPLYTIKEMFNPHFGLVPDARTVKGLLSLGFWSLIMVVTLKYVLVIMRADNKGEGGMHGADRAGPAQP
jgi:KUP system potassium uptake protein